MKRLFLFLIFMMVIPVLGIAGTAYYVDPNASAGGNGSYANPWNNISQINAHTFSTGDSVYFKVNTTLKPNARFNVRWGGTEANRVTIGAYHGKGQFGLRPGDRRPVLDQGWTNFSDHAPGPTDGVFSSDYDGLIQLSQPRSYITVRDLEFRNLWGSAIKIQTGSNALRGYHNHVRNCRFFHIGRSSIGFAYQWYGVVDGNYIQVSNRRKIPRAQGDFAFNGSAIDINGGGIAGGSSHNIVTNNTLTQTTESIGIYKGARYTTVRNNTVYNFSQSGIYASNSEYVLIEENLVYQPENIWPSWEQNKRAMIQVHSEGHVAGHLKMMGWFTIRNNYLAGGHSGIVLSTGSSQYGVYPKHTRVYGNRIVECETSFMFNHNSAGWESIYVYGNYSFLFTSGFMHSNNMNPLNVTWGVGAYQGNDYSLSSTGKKAYNFFNTKVATVTGNVAKNAEFNTVSLIKEKNWRALKPGEVTRDWFKFTNEMQDQVLPPQVQNVIIK